MNEHPTLPKEAEALEAPTPEAKTKGLVPRSSVFILVAVFVFILLVFFVIDITRSAKPASAANPEAVPEKKVEPNLGPAPQPQDILKRAEGQETKAQDEKKQLVRPSLSTPLPPGGTLLQTTPNSPVGDGTLRGPNDGVQGSSAPVGTQAAPVSAREERRAAAAEADVFAITPRGEASAVVADAGSSVAQAMNNLRLAGASHVGGAGAESDVASLVKAIQGQIAPASSAQDHNTQFLKEMGQDGIAPATYAQAPVSNNMIFQGTRIPVVTREAINSDLPGQLTAVSTMPMYDGVDQCRLLIPSGTKFIGQYSSQVKPGQARVMLGFKRMIMPDGRSVDLGGAGGADGIGASGIGGEVDNHFLKIFGYSFAVAFLADKASGDATYSVTQPNGTTTTTSVAGQVLAQTATSIMSRNINIPPTITVDPGTKLFVTIVRDISLKPVRNTCR